MGGQIPSFVFNAIISGNFMHVPWQYVSLKTWF